MIRLLLLSAFALWAGQKGTPPQPARAADVFARIKPLVFALKTAVRADAPKRAYGSAFVVGRHGRLLTNYHVVSDAVQFPRKYKVYLEAPDGPVEAEVVNLDVIHDLAVVQVGMEFDEALTLTDRLPRQGSRIYSLGLPSDLNLSIIEGVFNDALQHSLYEELHLSSPLNGGMSGGPTVDVDGQVVGINVAVLRDSQNISFAVPGKYALALLKDTDKPGRDLTTAVAAKGTTRNWHPEIQRQLLEVQRLLMKDLEEAGTESLRLEGWRVPQPPAYLKCWGDDAGDAKRVYTGYRQICFLPLSAFLADSLSTGTYELRYEVFSSGKLNTLQFGALLGDHYNEAFELLNDFILNFVEDEDHLLTDFQCHENRLRNASGVDLKFNYCLRGYLRYPDLVDADFKWATPVRGGSALVVRGTVRGFQRQNLSKFFQMQWDGVRRAGP